jgi:hypothetical protein
MLNEPEIIPNDQIQGQTPGPFTSRSRRWAVTINNYSPADLETIRHSLGDEARAGYSLTYAIIGLEVGDSGTPHVQGFLCFSQPRSLAQVKRIPGFQRGHYESCRGSVQQNIDYCSKEGRVEEFGRRPEQGARSDLTRVANLVNEGKSLYDIADECPVEFIKFHKGICALQACLSSFRSWKTEIYWFWGSTGTGKSQTAYAQAYEASSWYAKDPSHKWWDGYNGQEVVVIDDYRRDFCTFSFLLRLFDRYPLQIEIKGGTTQFLARKIYLTTPKDPVATWDSRTQEDLAQLNRRITEVRQFFPTANMMENEILIPAIAPGFNPPSGLNN